MFTFSSKMEIEHRVFSCAETGENYLAVVARGRVDIDGTREIFSSIAEITRAVVGCRVLVDFREGAYHMTSLETRVLFNEIKPALQLMTNRIALLSAPLVEQYDQLFMLSVCLLNQGLDADAFCELNRAVSWLAKKKQPPVEH